jgi:hypothetical protein
MLSQNLSSVKVFTRLNFEAELDRVQENGTILRLGFQTIYNDTEELINQIPIYFMPGCYYLDDGTVVLDGMDYPKMCTNDVSNNSITQIMKFLNRLHWGDINAFDKYVKTIEIPRPLILDGMYQPGCVVKMHLIDIEALKVRKNWHYGIKPVCMESDYPIIYPLPRHIKEHIMYYARWYRSALRFHFIAMLGDAEHYCTVLKEIEHDNLALEKKRNEENSPDFNKTNFVKFKKPRGRPKKIII